MGKTLYDKIWDAHLVHSAPGEGNILYIDRHLVHEVTSPQAFEGLRNTGRKVRRPDLTLTVPDHNVPTKDRAKGIAGKDWKQLRIKKSSAALTALKQITLPLPSD